MPAITLTDRQNILNTAIASELTLNDNTKIRGVITRNNDIIPLGDYAAEYDTHLITDQPNLQPTHRITDDLNNTYIIQSTPIIRANLFYQYKLTQC